MRLARFVGRRAAVSLPQLAAITFLTFWIIRLLPGDPAQGLAGLYGSPDVVAAIRERLGLNQSIGAQYWLYVKHLFQGDLGTSWFTSHAVSEELLRRLPATLELVTISVVVILVLGVALGVVAAVRPGGLVARGIRVYGGLSGAFPDFWLGLSLAFCFYFLLRWAPAPQGRLDIATNPPRHLTGLYTFDALFSGDWSALGDAWAHLALPVATLVIAYMGAVVKLTRATVAEMLQSDYCTYARACGLSSRQVTRYALRSSLPEIVTLIGITYTFLLAGDVLVENVFAWGGLGSYIVQSVSNSDYFPIQAFVLFAALFNLVIYLIVDVVHMAVDPRVAA